MKKIYHSKIQSNSKAYTDYFQSDEFKNIVQRSSNGRITYHSKSEDYGNGIIKHISNDGIIYYKNNKPHRENGPAKIEDKGRFEYFLDDNPENFSQSTKSKWIPKIEEEYYLHNEIYTKEEFYKIQDTKKISKGIKLTFNNFLNLGIHCARGNCSNHNTIADHIEQLIYFHIIFT